MKRILRITLKEIVEKLGWEGDYYIISAATGHNVSALTNNIMDFIEANPREVEEEQQAKTPAEFKWEDYHNQAMQNPITEDDWDDDWSEEDEEGVEIIYKP